MPVIIHLDGSKVIVMGMHTGNSPEPGCTDGEIQVDKRKV
jgi:hypothetical protein